MMNIRTSVSIIIIAYVQSLRRSALLIPELNSSIQIFIVGN
jgi:hypothetical protein